MFPERFPADAARDPKREAERTTYDLLATLPAAYTVFYSVAWLSKNRRHAEDGEVDFVVVHPDKGLLLLEVKGGQIRYDAQQGKWTSTDRGGEEHDIKDPFKQVTDAMYALRRKLTSLPRWSQEAPPIARCVVFPGVVLGDLDLRPDAPREVIIDRTGLFRMEQRVEEIFGWFDARGPALHYDGVKALELLLARSFQLRLPLGEALRDVDRRILELTEQQFDVLRLLGRKRRAAIAGGAGTGKTLLAVEKAKRLADQGFRTLLTCFNRPLADYLKASTEGTPNLVVNNFHGICFEAALAADVPLSDTDEKGNYPTEFFNQELPTALEAALEKGYERFDAIVVDEGQDFRDEWWLTLQLALADADDSILYVFFDDSQGIYRSEGSFLDELDQFPLNRNLRNTRSIHDLAMQFHNGPDIDCDAPEGVPVETVTVDRPDQLVRQVGKALHRLILEEDVAPHDIAVLTLRRLSAALPGVKERIGIFPVTFEPAGEPQKVVVQTVHRFKGLERSVVVLVVSEGCGRPKDDPLLYVGVSRARGHLVMVGAQGLGVAETVPTHT